MNKCYDLNYWGLKRFYKINLLPVITMQREGGVESIINILQLLGSGLFHFLSPVNRVRNQGFDEQKLEFFYKSQKLQFTYPVIPRPHKGRPSYKRSLQPSKGNIQRFKTWNFFTFSYCSG